MLAECGLDRVWTNRDGGREIWLDDLVHLRIELFLISLSIRFGRPEADGNRFPIVYLLPEVLARESFISTARAAPVLRTVIDDYAAKAGIALKQSNDAETLSGGMSLVASTGGFTLLPLYVRHALIPSVVARPLRGEVPTIGLMMGYNKSNTSPLLKRFLHRADELVNHVSQAEAYSRSLKGSHRKRSI